MVKAMTRVVLPVLAALLSAASPAGADEAADIAWGSS
jgi:hypothetical protein